MATEIPIPGTDQELDPDDGASGMAMTIIVTIVGFALAFGAAVGGQRLFNYFADQSPNVQAAEVF